MAYYLKKTKLKGRTYLSIDESFYSHEKKGTAHRCYKSLGSVETWIQKGMDDPISHFQQEVDSLNQKKALDGVRKISDRSPSLYLGYFPLKAILDKLQVKKYLDTFQLAHSFEYDFSELLFSLIYARAVNPCSKRRTFHEGLPQLYHSPSCSYDQLLSSLSFLGIDYEKFVEIFTAQVKAVFGIDPSRSYFDCTNFYFEIDREDDFRRKGPSKENRKDPIVGLGLLLDRNQIPIAMKLYPGNQSEKPVLRDVKDKNGKLLYRVKSCVDKFPYRVKQGNMECIVKLTEKRLVTYNPSLATKKRYEINRMVEKAKALTASQAKRAEFGETGKYVNFTDKDGEKAAISINQEAIDKDLKFAGYNLLVTSETEMSDLDIYNTYHNLWRIEESFKVMKSDLDARPVFLQKETAIKGHFLICYLTVLLERILQFKVLENKYSTSEIFDFMKDFRVTWAETKYINTTTSTDFINGLAEKTGLPLMNYFLTKTQIKSILNYKL